jgi:ankyrin repeat protein
MNPPPKDDDPLITRFKPKYGQWELTDENIQRIDPHYGQTILHNYCKFLNSTPLEVFKDLIESKGLSVCANDRRNVTPIHAALRFFRVQHGGNVATLIYLLSQGDVDVNKEHQLGQTLLYTACESISSFSLDIFKYLIDIKGGNVNVKDVNGHTPISAAFRSFTPNDGSNIDILIYLLNQKDVDVSITDRYGYTLLHTACHHINRLPLDIFKTLIETKGADVNVQDNYHNTPIHIALRNFKMSSGGDIAVILYLLSQESLNVKVRGDWGRTLIYSACTHVNQFPIDVFKLLIEKRGADINIPDSSNKAPVYVAFLQFLPDEGDFDVLTYLIGRNDLNFHPEAPQCRTLLHLACLRGIWDIKTDTFQSQMVELIVQSRVEQILDEATLQKHN